MQNQSQTRASIINWLLSLRGYEIRLIASAFALSLLCICSSCATLSLWESTDPDEYVKIAFTQITEEELQEKGAKYIRDDEEQAFYVEKESSEKFKDWTIRALVAPVTIVVDGAAIAAVVVAIAAIDGLDDDDD